MFNINLHGKDSIYEQIRDQILRYIELGIIRPNDKLPSVRQLALELGINPNTVMKAYQELELKGYIYTLSKKGAFVSDIHQSNNDDILNEITLLIKKAKDAHLERTEIDLIIKKIYEE